jgi:hypothetical protein
MVMSFQEDSSLSPASAGEMRDVFFERGEPLFHLGDARTFLQKIEHDPFSQLDHVLWKISQGESLGGLHSSVVRRDEAEYAAKKCGFSSSVVADKAEAASRGDRPIESREDAVLAEGQRKSGDADHGMPPFCRNTLHQGKGRSGISVRSLSSPFSRTVRIVVGKAFFFPRPKNDPCRRNRVYATLPLRFVREV